MAVALYAGSFNPPTLGHLDIIERAASVADRLLVAVAVNPEKRALFSVQERLDLIRADCAGMDNVEVHAISGATVEFARQHDVDVLVRGLRTSLDLDNERAMAEVNRRHGFESLFLLTSGHLAHVSSSVVRQVLAAGLSLDGLVSPRIAEAIRSLASHERAEEHG